MVFRMMSRSSFRDQLSMYCVSSCTHWSKSMVLRPLTCQMQVMPGRILKRRFWFFWYWLTSSGMGGRGPTTDMSPFNTLINCGNSSKDYLRRKRPTRVTRGSYFILKTGPLCSFSVIRLLFKASAFTTMVLNFKQANRRPFSPTRCW